MKTILILFTIIIILGCSNTDTNNKNIACTAELRNACIRTPEGSFMDDDVGRKGPNCELLSDEGTIVHLGYCNQQSIQECKISCATDAPRVCVRTEDGSLKTSGAIRTYNSSTCTCDLISKDGKVIKEGDCF